MLNMLKSHSGNTGSIALWNGVVGRRFDFKFLLTSLKKGGKSLFIKEGFREISSISFSILDSAELVDPVLYLSAHPVQKYQS